jgi:H/ACA ribonucleoprotein complex subunit 4
MEKLPFEKIKREILIKKESTTDPKYGKEKSPIKELINYGIININKPQGPTSHQIADYVKKILKIKRCGHSGTLDPNVTGSLPVALGDATRIVQTLLKSGKEYVCLMHINKELKESKILKTAETFIGTVSQLPPVRSAIKRQLRKREIYYIKILEIKGKDILFKIGCEAGFYIRKFCVDFAKKLKVNGHMIQLVRTKTGPFTDKKWHSLHDLKDAYEFYKQGNEKELKKIIQPVEAAVEHLPKIWIQDSAVDTLCHGADLNIPGISKLDSEIKKDDLVAVLTLKNELICLGVSLTASEEIIKNNKGKAVKTKKVFMKRNTYPKYTTVK